MIDAATVLKIRQKKLDSLAAKHLHVKRAAQLNRWIKLVDSLAMAVPVVYFAVRYIAKDTEYQFAVEIAWEILAVLLLASMILKLVYRWQEETQIHSRLLGENISLVGQADNLLSEQNQISPETARLFFVMAEKSEAEDRNILGQPSTLDRQFSYREAIKESEPGNSSVVCPQCKSSPWQFVPGSCQLCGNTPAK
jgi:mobilome CxxCx(11)CxxC protein